VNCINERRKAEARDQIANQSSHGAVPWIAAATGTQSKLPVEGHLLQKRSSDLLSK
jgi:hypothetical protein